jgi:hypothetical protein
MEQGLDRAENIAWKARGGLSGSTFNAKRRIFNDIACMNKACAQ